MHPVLAVLVAAFLAPAVSSSPYDAFSSRIESRTAFDVDKAALQAWQAVKPLSTEDAERLARYILADASADAADYERRWTAVANEIASARRQIAIMQAGGPYPPDWQGNRWLKARSAAVQSEARALFEHVFLDQSVLSMEAELDAVGKAAFRTALAPERNAILHANADWLKRLLAQIGWFDISRYGEEASQAAWLIVQHADHDPEWQEAVLKALAGKVKSGDMQGKFYAYLTDRVAVNAGRPQVYGTQGGCTGPGEWQPKRVIDPDSLDRRRAEVGLEPIAAYKARFIAECE